MTRESRFQAFGEDLVQLRLQSANVTGTGGARRHPISLLFLELAEIEVITTVLLFFGASEALFGDGEQGKSRWKRQRFLRAGKHHVDAERIHLQRKRGER